MVRMAGHLNMNTGEKQSQNCCEKYRVFGTCLEATSQIGMAVTHAQGRRKVAD